MLSLLSLIIASGQVLRTDTNLWEPSTYPDPRLNATQCNTIEGSTLCDPDNLLMDNWREDIRKTIAKHQQILENSQVPYVEEAKELCQSNQSEPVQIFVALARKIHASSNQSITTAEITKFGDDLRDAFGLESTICKNSVLIVGIEFAKEIYVWTGSHLALKHNQMDFAQKYKNMFTDYQEEINKVVDDIGELILNPNRDATTTAAPVETESSTTEPETTPISTTTPAPERVIPGWIYIIIALLVLAVITISSLALWYIRRGMSHNIHPLSDGKTPRFPDAETGSQYSSNINHRSMTIITNDERLKSENSSASNNNSPKGKEDSASIESRLSSRRNSVPITQAALNIINKAAGTVLLRSSGYFSSTESASSVEEERKTDTKVSISPTELTTDVVLARRHSETLPHPTRNADQFSSF